MNGSGQVAYTATLNTGNGLIRGIFAGAPGAIQSVALEGTAAPVGGIYGGFRSIVLNGSGQVAFYSSLSGAGVSEGIFVGSPGLLQAAVLRGSVAPSGGNFAALSDPVINNAGKVAFGASLSGSTSSGGIFAGFPGALQTVALQGTAAPAGGNYSTFYREQAILNGAGQVLFTATLTGGTSSKGIFAGAPGAVQAVALQGTAAPAGGNYSDFVGTSVLNGAGQVAFLATLTGGTSSKGLFAGPVGGLMKVVIVGDVIDVNPGVGVDNRTVSDITFFPSTTTFGSGGQDGQGIAFNDSGILTYRVQFTDGNLAIFTTQMAAVPEPATIAMIAMSVSGAIFVWYRRRQRLAIDQEAEIVG